MTDRAAVDRAAGHRRFEALDSLRGVAAVTVALGHMQTQGRIATSAYVLNGYMLVDFFFVLSGFVIAASYRERIAGGFSVPRFMALRLGRLYPLHLVLLIIVLLLEIANGVFGASSRAAFTGGNSLGMLFANLFLVQSFVGPEQLSWNGPSWSIAVEFWTYLAFALLFARGRRATNLLAAAIALGGLAYMAAVSERGINLFHVGAFARCLFGFALGVLTHAFHRRRPHIISSRVLATVVEVVVTLGVAIAIGHARPDRWSLLVPLLFPALVYVFAGEAGGVSRLLRTRPAALLGLLSYSIYMIHQIIWFRVLNLARVADRLTAHRFALIDPVDDHRLGGGVWFGDAASIVMILLLVAAAYGTYRVIERPGQRWSRARILGSRAARPVATRIEEQAPTF